MKNKRTILLVLSLLLGIFCTALSHKLMYISGGEGTYKAIGALTPRSLDTRHTFVHWESATTIPISTNQNGAGDGILPEATLIVVDIATQAWQNVSTSYINLNAVSFTNHTLNSTDGLNTVYWAEAGDPAFLGDDPWLTGDAVAITVVTVNANHELLDADIIMNGRDCDWTLGSGIYDVQSVVTHELGHALGIHHSDLNEWDTGTLGGVCPSITYTTLPTMYASAIFEGIDARSLEADDKEGLTFLYPQSTFTPPDAPTLNTPANNEYNVLTGPVPISWNVVAGATSYYLEVSQDGQYPFIDKSGITSTSIPATDWRMWGFSPLSLEDNTFRPATTYTWQVTAYNNGIPGPTSETRTFSTAPGTNQITWPPPITLLDVSTEYQPRTFTLYWNAFDVETIYHLQIVPYCNLSQHTSFLSPVVFEDLNVVGTSKQITLPSGIYRWRVRAVDGPFDWTYAYSSGVLRVNSTISNDATWYGGVGLPENTTVSTGKKLTLLNGTTLTIPTGVSLTVNGTLEMQGDVTVVGGGNLAISSTGTLNVLAGAVVKFGSGMSLTVNGRLNAVGTPSNRITLTSATGITPGSWGNIYISGSSANGSSIKFANILYGTQISVVNAANVSINDCFILNSSNNGINFSGSSGVASNNRIENSNIYHGIVVQNGSYVQSDQNTIKKNNTAQPGAGIYYLHGSSGTLFQNDIRGWNYGVGCYNGSSPQFRNNPTVFQNRNNRITGCQKGVYAVINSRPVLGEPVTGWANNCFYYNTNNIYFTGGGSIDAVAAYWGTTNPQATFILGTGCTVYTDLMLTTNPWGSISLPKSSTSVIAELPELSTDENPAQINTSNQNTSEGLFAGIRMREEKGKRLAKDFFKSYLAKHTDDQAAYVELYNCADDETLDEIIQYFSALPTKASKEQEQLLTYLYLRKGDIGSAKAVNDRIISNNKNSEIGARAKMSNFYIALYNEGDVEKAIKLLNEVVAHPQLITTDEFELAKNALETYPGFSGEQQSQLKKISLVKAEVPDHYELFQNYPNPFNPTTTIDYQIPKDGRVTVKIYDMLGREIRELVNEHKTVGRYSVSFDASGLASGMYIYKLYSQPTDGRRKDVFTTVKKMLLVK